MTGGKKPATSFSVNSDKYTLKATGFKKEGSALKTNVSKELPSEDEKPWTDYMAAADTKHSKHRKPKKRYKWRSK